MNEGIFHVGMKVSIELERNEKNLLFPSKVEDKNQKNIIIDMPMRSNSTFFVGLGETLKIYFCKGQIFYCIDGIVISKSYVPIPVLTVEILGKPYRNQRRDYFRINVNIATKIKLLENEEVLDCVINDISGSGAMIFLSKALKKRSTVSLSVPVFSKTYDLKAEIVRIERDYTRVINPYNIGLRFLNMPEGMRDELIKFILSEQRRQRKKGLI